MENLSFLAVFDIFLALAVAAAPRDPFFWIPHVFLRMYWWYKRISFLKKTCIGARVCARKHGNSSPPPPDTKNR